MIFQNFQNPNGKNLDLQVNMCSAKNYLRAEQILQGSLCYKFYKNNIFGYATVPILEPSSGQHQ